jgi:hypothetical protein
MKKTETTFSSRKQFFFKTFSFVFWQQTIFCIVFISFGLRKMHLFAACLPTSMHFTFAFKNRTDKKM